MSHKKKFFARLRVSLPTCRLLLNSFGGSASKFSWATESICAFTESFWQEVNRKRFSELLALNNVALFLCLNFYLNYIRYGKAQYQWEKIISVLFSYQSRYFMKIWAFSFGLHTFLATIMIKLQLSEYDHRWELSHKT